MVASAEGDVSSLERGEDGRMGHNDEQDRLVPARQGGLRNLLPAGLGD